MKKGSKPGQEKQSISGQRQPREKGGGGGGNGRGRF